MYTTCILEFQHLLKWSPPNLISGCSQILIKHSSKCKFYFTLPVFLSYTLTKFKPFFIHWNFFRSIRYCHIWRIKPSSSSDCDSSGNLGSDINKPVLQIRTKCEAITGGLHRRSPLHIV